MSVGIDHDTAEFAAAAIERWWRKMGRRRFPKARELYITADGGGSNGSRSRLWKVALQKLANRTGLTLSVSHFPPGTSKWNKIERDWELGISGSACNAAHGRRASLGSHALRGNPILPNAPRRTRRSNVSAICIPRHLWYT